MLKRELSLRSILFFSLICTSILLFQACGDDDVVGCTDPAADNYDANANVSGDCNYTGCTDPNAENYNAQANIEGDCVYARDKFLGNYLGSLTCPGGLSFISDDTLEFSIAEFIDPDSTHLIILSLTVEGNTLDLAGSVDGDELSIMHMLSGVLIPTPLGDVAADITATGLAMMTNDNTSLEGTLGLLADAGLLTLEDNCSIIGVKQ